MGTTAFGWNGIFMAFATEIYGKETTATGLGWAITVSTIGTVAGPPLFGYIVDKAPSYNIAWLVFGIVTMISAFLMMLIKENKATS